MVLTMIISSITSSCQKEEWLDYSPIDMYSAKIEIDDKDAPSFLNVAAVSIQSHKTDKQATIENIRRMVKTIKIEQQNVEVIVFPELVMEWYSTDDKEVYQRKMAETIPGKSTDAITEIASENNVVVIFGLTEIDTISNKLYNSQVLIRPNKELVKYRKRNLNSVDIKNGMSAGTNNLVVVTIGQANCAMFICSDMQNASITQELGNSDVDVILQSTTSTTDLNTEISYVGLQMNKWIVWSNRFGKENLANYTGFIQIINPFGSVSKRAEGNKQYVYRELGIY